MRLETCRHLFSLTFTQGSRAVQEATRPLRCNLMCHASENFSNEINIEVLYVTQLKDLPFSKGTSALQECYMLISGHMWNKVAGF